MRGVPDMWPPVGVLIATYQRLTGLARLLLSLEELTYPGDVGVVVVDNDPNGSAEVVVREWRAPERFSVHYAVESVPGISAARNRCLEIAGAYSLVAFVDDDEWVRNDWLTKLVQVWRETGATAVSGPVIYNFQVPPRPWLIDAGFYILPQAREMGDVPFAATNNLLVCRSSAEELGVSSFDERFGLSGGSDALYTRTIVARGGRICWTNNAVVEEEVPAHRTTVRWALRRARRTGSTLARVNLVLGSSTPLKTRIIVASQALSRIAAGTIIGSFAIVLRRKTRAGKELRTAMRGLGMLSSVFGRHIAEYRRA